MPDEPHDPTPPEAAAPSASVSGSGAVAQGPGARAAGERGVVVETNTGTIITGDVVQTFADSAYVTRGLENPFLGLRAFTYADRDRFAGRERLVATTAAQLTEPGAQATLLFVTGASGSGKSSFVQAGLLPALETRYREAGLEPRLAVMRPGRYPLAALAEAIRKLGLPVDDAFDAVRPFMIGVPSEPPPASAVALLVIDQFEELFTQSDPAQRAALVAILSSLPPFAKLRTHLIATLRADYLPDLFQRQSLYDIAKQGIDLRAMSEAELALAIQKPVQQAHPGVRFEPALLERLARDAAQDAAFLPLLQVTLESIWQKGSLTLSNYGTLTEAIRDRAEDVYRFEDYDGARQIPRSADEQQAILALLLDLVEVSLDDDARRDVRRRRTEAELVSGAPQREKLIADLTGARLLSKALEAKPRGEAEAGFDRVEVVDIIHESLITQWDRLRDAVAQHRARLQKQARFSIALRDWQADPRRLLGGIDLAEAEELDKQGNIELQNPDAQQFLKQSIAAREEVRNRELERVRQLAEERSRSLKRTRVFLMLVALLGVGLAVAGYAAYNAVRQLGVATLSQFLIAQSSKSLSRNPDTALLLGVEAARRQGEPTAERQLDVADYGYLLEANQCCSDQSLGVLRGHDDRVWAVAYDPADGDRLVSAGDDGRVLVWDTAERRIARVLTDTPSLASVYAVAFSPDGKWLISGNGDGTVVVRSTADWQPAGPPLKGHDSNVHAVAFSPDGSKFASGGADGKMVVWDLATLSPLTQTKLNRNWIWSLAFTPDGSSIASGGQDRLIWLWDFGGSGLTSTVALSLPNHAATVTSIAMNRDPEQPRMVSGDAGGGVILWDLSAWRRERARPAASSKMTAASGIVWGLAMNPDGKSLVTGSQSGRVKVWAMPPPDRPVASVRGLDSLSLNMLASPSGVFRVAVRPDGSAFAAAGIDSRVSLWSTSEAPALTRLPGTPDSVVERNGLMIAAGRSAAGDQPFVATRAMAGAAPAALRTLTTTAAALTALSADGRRLATVQRDGAIRIWDAQTGALSASLSGPLAFSVTAVALSSAAPEPAPSRLAVLTSGPPTVLPPRRQPLYAAAGDAGGTVVVWDAESGARIRELQSDNGSAIRKIAFSPNGEWLLVGDCAVLIRGDAGVSCGRGELRAWRMSALGAPPVRILGKSGNVAALAVAPDNDTVAIGSEDWTVGVWRLSEPGALRFSFTGHTDDVTALAFSPDGRLLASGDKVWRAIVWSLATGTQVGGAFHEHDGEMTALTFGADGRSLYSANTDRTVIRHELDVPALMRRACRLAGRNLAVDEWSQYLAGEAYRPTCDELAGGVTAK